MYYGDEDSYFAEYFDHGHGAPKSGSTNVSNTEPDKSKAVWLNRGNRKKELPLPSEMANFVRAEDGCYEVISSSAWGSVIISVRDPDANTKLTHHDRKGIKLIDDFPVLPKELWGPIIGLYFHYCKPPKNQWAKSDDNEVSVVLLRRMDDLSKWKVVVPKQIVDGASVRADFEECCDIVTGEKYDSFPPIDKDDDGNDVFWVHAGSSHSHNTMGAFFSSTDDESELGVPGMHIVVGKIDNKKGEYCPKASIVLRGERKEIDIDDVVDTTPFSAEFHKNCLELVTEKSYSYNTTPYSSNRYGSYNGGYNGGYNTTPISRPLFLTGGPIDQVWVPDAEWDNKNNCWTYEGLLEGFDVVTTVGETEYIGRVTKHDLLGLGIKTGTHNGVEHFVGWAKLKTTEVQEYDYVESALEDTDAMLPVLDEDENEFGIWGYPSLQLADEEETANLTRQNLDKKHEERALTRREALAQLIGNRRPNPNMQPPIV
tara:strand:- start:4303 stop:5754 length:1452 start_codon:yes stop_codon:yes gene_type:complete